MEVKESTISGSPENTESGSPTPISSGVISQLGSAMPAVVSGDGGFSGGMKKKRGRPRKYDLDGNISFAYARKMVSPPPGFTITTSSSSEFGPKRGRGKPSGSGNWHKLASLGGIFADTAGGDFTPHVITVQTGEDVAAKIHSLGQKGPRGICVLSANGSISNVTIRQPGSSGGLLTYEGRFEILSLTGSYTMTETNEVKSRTGGLSITLAGPDGRVVGGSVAGWLTAASPIQVVVGSFIPFGCKAHKRKHQRESTTAPPVIPAAFPDARPPETQNPQAMPMIHAEQGPPVVSPLPAQSHSEADDSVGSGHNLNVNVVSSHNTPEWLNGSEPSTQQRLYPDINLSVPGV